MACYVSKLELIPEQADKLYLDIVTRLVAADVARSGLDYAVRNSNVLADAETMADAILKDKVVII